MKNILKFGLILLGLIMVLNANDNTEEKNLVKTLNEAAKTYTETQAKEISSLNKESVKQIDENIIIEYPYKPKQVKINGVDITIVVVNVLANPVIVFEDKIHTAVVKYVKESRIVTLNDEFITSKSKNVKEANEQLLKKMNKLNQNIEIKRSYLEYLINSNDAWEKELDIKKGILNKLSKDSEKFFCENSKSPYLKNDILVTLKYQDIKYYEEHKEAVDNLPDLLINSTLKENASCPNGHIVTGTCGDWKCSKGVEYGNYK